MSIRKQQVCALGGLGMAGLFLVGFAIAGFISPPSPNDSAEKIARMFEADRTAIRIGIAMSMMGAALLVPWAVSMFVHLRRADPGRSPLPWVGVLSITLLSLEFIYLLMFWQVAAFREDQSPEIVRMLNDMAWIPFIGLTSTGIVGAISFGAAMLSDKRAEPIFPRWLGYTNIWAGTLFTPGTFCVFFKSGPLAYNGLISWYMVLTVYCIWMVVNTIVLLRVIREDAGEPAEGVPQANGAVTVEQLAIELAAVRRELAEMR